MTLIDRFLTAFRGEDRGAAEKPGLIQNEDGSVDLIAPDGTRTPLGGGGSQPLVGKVILTDAQIKALPSTEIELLPAPGTGKIYAVLATIIGPLSGSTYTNINGSSAFYGYSGDDATIQANVPTADVLVSANVVYAPGPLTANTSMNAADDIDQAVLLGIDNGGDGDLTGGDPANLLPITVVYALIDTTPT